LRRAAAVPLLLQGSCLAWQGRTSQAVRAALPQLLLLVAAVVVVLVQLAVVVRGWVGRSMDPP
jgi:hypothetical protein